MPPMIRLRIRHYVVTLLLGLLAGACANPPGAPKLDADAGCAAAKACPACPACPGQPGQAAAPPAAPPLQASTWRAIDGWLQDDSAQAWPALRASCSTLSRQADWKLVCERAGLLGAAPSTTEARQFFEANFTPWQLTNADGSTQGLVTGYGGADFINLIDAQRTLLEFRLAEVEARIQRELALADLSLQVMGVPPSGAPILDPTRR